MRFWFYTLISLLFASCSDKGNLKGLSEITIQKYSFHFPGSYKKTKLEAFNAYVGKISNDTITFDFHFSDHVQPPVKTVSEFFDSEEWKAQVSLYIATNKHFIGDIIFSTPRKAMATDSSIGNGCDYVVRCKFDSLEFEAPIFLPDKMRGVTIVIDTIFGQRRETYIPDIPGNGITGIFIKTIPKNRKDSLQRDALLLTTTNLTKNQQKDVLKIFSTFQLKENN